MLLGNMLPGAIELPGNSQVDLPSAPSLTPPQIMASFDACIHLWDVSDDSTMRATNGTDEVVADAEVGLVFDQVGSFHLSPPGDDRPVNTNGLLFATPDRIGNASPPSQPSAATYCAVWKGTDPAGIILSDTDVNPSIGIWQSGNPNGTNFGSSGTSYVDGVAQADRGDLSTAMADDAVHRFDHRGADMTPADSLYFGGYAGGGGFFVNGNLLPACVLDESAGDYTDALAYWPTFYTYLIDGVGLGNP
ncbi:hypothetical protein ACRAQ6_13880 [Erythrobacter sp. HA6-11]